MRMDRLKPFFPAMKPEWTAKSHLPGGDIADADFERFLSSVRERHPWLPASLANHYCRLYGTRAAEVLNGAENLADLGREFGSGFYEREALYLMQHEWARAPEDILERRTKHGLRMSAAERKAFADWMARRQAKAA